MRYFIEFAYKGTKFHGWQIQQNAETVQGNLEKAFAIILKQKIEITGSSRTDTGVHAAQQFAHFEYKILLTKEELATIVHRMNAILPRDISISTIFLVSDKIHARFDAIYRKYTYRILQEKNPFLHEIGYSFFKKLDIEKMNEAGKVLLQNIDYQAFSKIHTEVKTFNCVIEYAFWEQQNGQVLFHIKADRFLRGMVRTIVGTMIEIGLHRMEIEEFEAIILSKNRKKAGRSVPAEGLTLMEVGYDF